MSLNILISDAGGYTALVQRLVREGHQVYMTEPKGVPAEFWSDFGFPQDTVKYLSNTQIIHMAKRGKIDLNVGFEVDETYHSALRMFGIRNFGFTQTVKQLEDNRALGASFFDDPRSPIKLVPAIEFGSLQELESWLFNQSGPVYESFRDNGSRVVIKSADTSVGHATNDLRCHFADLDDYDALVNVVKRDPGFFDATGAGGVRLESFIEGIETCFGFFRSTSGGRSSHAYTCNEHKDAQNGSRSGVLTGEVGTTLTWHDLTGENEAKNPAVNAVVEYVSKTLNAQEFEVGCGMLDVNTIITDDGQVYLIEWTTRWGRPTLELLLASIEQDFGTLLWELADPKGSFGPVELRTVKYCVGTVLFQYGYPRIGTEERCRSPFWDDLTEQSCLLPMMGYFDNQDPEVFVSSDRYGIVCTTDTGILSARLLHAEALTLVATESTFPMVTWRDDVGSKWEMATDYLNKVKLKLGLEN